jgi:hypothetical protein
MGNKGKKKRLSEAPGSGPDEVDYGSKGAVLGKMKITGVSAELGGGGGPRNSPAPGKF